LPEITTATARLTQLFLETERGLSTVQAPASAFNNTARAATNRYFLLLINFAAYIQAKSKRKACFETLFFLILIKEKNALI
jgi:hypothetical protein